MTFLVLFILTLVCNFREHLALTVYLLLQFLKKTNLNPNPCISWNLVMLFFRTSYGNANKIYQKTHFRLSFFSHGAVYQLCTDYQGQHRYIYSPLDTHRIIQHESNQSYDREVQTDEETNQSPLFTFYCYSVVYWHQCVMVSFLLHLQMIYPLLTRSK